MKNLKLFEQFDWENDPFGEDNVSSSLEFEIGDRVFSDKTTYTNITGMNAGLWKLGQNASGRIHFGNLDTTIGTGGYLQATLTRDTVSLVCVVANNEWNVVGSIGNIEIV